MKLVLTGAMWIMLTVQLARIWSSPEEPTPTRHTETSSGHTRPVPPLPSGAMVGILWLNMVGVMVGILVVQILGAMAVILEAMVVTRVAIMVDIMETMVEVIMGATLEAMVGVIMEAILEVMVGAMVATPEAMVEALEAFSVVEVPTAEDQTVEPLGMEDHLAAMEAAVGDTNQGKLVPIPTPEATPRKE